MPHQAPQFANPAPVFSGSRCMAIEAFSCVGYAHGRCTTTGGMRRTRWLIASAVAMGVLLVSGWPEVHADDAGPAQPAPQFTAEQEAFFEKQVRPVLVARCLECHGEAKQKGDLRLDSREALLKGNDGGAAIIVGKPDDSRFIEVIGYRSDIKMPPKGKLPNAEIEILKEWIKIGAPFPGASAAKPRTAGGATPESIAQARASHWSFQPLQETPPPAVHGKDWPISTIDQFVLARLEQAKLGPNPQADRRTLIRRATFDLTGLPPTPAELDAFENDHAADAWARVIDRLLASPHYGERWGRHWLDLARYADTKGYVFTEEVKYPFSYTYRDYVIRAFNNDVPYDRFLQEQLAADQLSIGEDKTPLAAMGFLTLGRRFGNNTHDIIDDRIDVVCRGLMGLTVTCARCHDHKYDPIPTEDYYSMYGVFANSTEPADLPQIAPAVENEAHRAYEAELNKRESELNDFKVTKSAELMSEFRTHIGDYLVAVVRKGEPQPPPGTDTSLATGEVRTQLVEKWRKYIQEAVARHHPVFAPWQEFARLEPDHFQEQAAQIVARLNAAVTSNPPAPNSPDRVNPLVVKAFAEAPLRSMADVSTVYGKLLLAVHEEWVKSSTSDPPPAALPDANAEELRQVLYGEKTPTVLSQDEAFRLLNRAVKDQVAKLKRAVDALKANSPAAPPRAMVLNDAPNPHDFRVLIRGNPGRPGPEAVRRFLRVVSGPDDKPFSQGSGRLELARAITRPDNPLTVRVIVNRVWQHHFGAGLVRTSSDFGARGEPPTHPELLDYLARLFIADGWSIKKLHRRILLSRVYQQTAADRPDGLQIDPDNRLLWKMNRQRLEFEPVRDALLAVAGRLDPAVGGRPVNLFIEPFSTRRTIYGFIDRQDLPGVLRAFDFASPDVSTGQRSQTTVPQQALFAMNSTFVDEQVRQIAARPELKAAASPGDQVAALYRLMFLRAPDPAELALGVSFLAARSSDEPAPPRALADAKVWHYGYGEYNVVSRRVVSFTALPHFQGDAWRGGPSLPDPQIGWVMLNARGGHPGGDARHAAIRRWVAPQPGIVHITGVLNHPASEGDGVRGRVISSRIGELGDWEVHHGQAETRVDRVEVEPGDSLDFVVDCRTRETHDTFAWAPVLRLEAAVAANAPRSRTFDAAADFRGPESSAAPPAKPLSVLEEYVQALFMTNEFVFVD